MRERERERRVSWRRFEALGSRGREREREGERKWERSWRLKKKEGKKKTSIEAPLARPTTRESDSPALSRSLFLSLSFARKGASRSSSASSISRSRGCLRLCSTARAREKGTREGGKGHREETRENRAPKSLLNPIAAAAAKRGLSLSLPLSPLARLAAYLVLGLGSQPLEERVALEGARRARLFLVRHLAFPFFRSAFFSIRFALARFFFPFGPLSAAAAAALLLSRLRVGVRFPLSGRARAVGFSFSTDGRKREEKKEDF